MFMCSSLIDTGISIARLWWVLNFQWDLVEMYPQAEMWVVRRSEKYKIVSEPFYHSQVLNPPGDHS